MKSNFNIILFILYVTLSSCTSQNCIDIPSRFTQQIEIEEAKKIVNERIQKSTKGSSENEKRLFRFNSELIWDNARTSFTERTYSIDIPVKDAKDLYFILRDGNGHYVSRCYHVVTLLRIE